MTAHRAEDVASRSPARILVICTVSEIMTASAPEIHVGFVDLNEPQLPLAVDGSLTYVWHSRFGEILVEVRDGQTFVNGEKVEPADHGSRNSG